MKKGFVWRQLELRIFCASASVGALFGFKGGKDQVFYEDPKLKLIYISDSDIIVSSNEDEDQGIWDKQ